MSWWAWCILRGIGVALVTPVAWAAADHWTRRSRSGWAWFGAFFVAFTLAGLSAPFMVATS